MSDKEFDVAIVGAGPAGISAALMLADRGVRTIVFERGEFPGAKNISGGVLYGHDLSQIVPGFAEKKCPIERNIVESRLWYLSREGGYSLAYRDKLFYEKAAFNAFTVGRAKFDRWFARQAVEKGAVVVSSTTVIDLIRDGSGVVIGVKTDRPDGEMRAHVVLLADGVNSPLAAKTGFRQEPKPQDIALAVKEVIEIPEELINERFGVEPGQGVTIEIVGEATLGMDGIAVIYTNKNSLSLCIGANLSDYMKHKVRPYEMLDDFKEHPMVAPLIKNGQPKEYMAHWIAEGGYDSIPGLCGDGYLIAGDSGMLFNALHREGSNMAMTSGRFAAETIIEALEKGDFGPKGLAGYISRLNDSYIMKDLKKYRNFNTFRLKHRELFSTLPPLLTEAAGKMLTVNGIPKKQKQKEIWKKIKKEISLLGLFRLILDAIRSVR